MISQLISYHLLQKKAFPISVSAQVQPFCEWTKGGFTEMLFCLFASREVGKGREKEKAVKTEKARNNLGKMNHWGFPIHRSDNIIEGATFFLSSQRLLQEKFSWKGEFIRIKATSWARHLNYSSFTIQRLALQIQWPLSYVLSIASILSFAQPILLPSFDDKSNQFWE